MPLAECAGKRKAGEETERLRVQEAQRKAQEDAAQAAREKEAADLKAKEDADAAAKAAAEAEEARRVAEEAREQERLANERMEAAIKAKQEAAEAEAIRLAEGKRLEAERLAAEAAAEAELLRKAKEEAERLELKAKEEAAEAAAAAKAQAEEEAARLAEQKVAEKAEQDRMERLAKEAAERQEAEAQANESLAQAPAVAPAQAGDEAQDDAAAEAAALKVKRQREREEGARQAQDRLAQEKMMMKRREMSLHNRRHASRKSEEVTNKSPSGRSKAGLALAAELSELTEAPGPATPGPATPGGSDQAFMLTPASENRLAKKSLKKSRKSKRPGQSVRGGFLARFSRRKQTSGANSSTPRKAKSRRSPLKDKQATAAPGVPGEFKRLPGMVSVADLDSGEVDNSEYEKLDPRAVDAARWTDKVVRQLIDEIKQRGTTNADGQAVVTFGTLFEETANIFDALVGILKTAKKYFVVSFGPDQLWQGKDDNVEITLLKETHSGVLVKRRKLKNMKAPGANVKSKGFGGAALTGNQKCHMCSKTVYQNERVVASDKPFHKNCFRCKVCNNVLKTTDFCTVDDKFFCPTHYREMIMSAGGPGSENKAGVADNFRKERRLSDV